MLVTAAEKHLVEATIAAKDQTIVVLTDVIDHLRFLLAQKPDEAPAPGPAFDRIEDSAPERSWMSEEEEDVMHMYAAGHLTEDQRDAALQALGVGSTLTLVK